ncbi:MAG: hypothetical protein Q8O87_02220 [bacterium]|nr:hypothetical protein [bacterium]
MHKQRLTILILAAVGMAATFVPWATIPGLGSISGTQGDGWVTFGLFAIPLIISLLGDKSQSLRGGMLWGAIVSSVLAAAIGVWKIVDINNVVGDNPIFQVLGGGGGVGIGLYLVVIAGIVLSIVAFVMKGKAAPQNQEMAQ